MGWAFGVGAVIITAAAVLVQFQDGACARDTDGEAIYYSVSDNAMRCSYGAVPKDGLYASLPVGAYGQAAACGSYLDVVGPSGKTARVLVIDRCTGCGPNVLDLGQKAFEQLSPLSAGRIPVRWKPVRDPQPAARLSFRVKRGSHPDWMALLVLGHGNPLESVEVRSSGEWRALKRGLDNYWVTSGAGEGPFQLRVKDVYGNSRSFASLTLKPGETQRTNTRLYDGAAKTMTTTHSAIPAPVTASASIQATQRRTPHCG